MNIHFPAILMFTRGTRFWHTAIYLFEQPVTVRILLWIFQRSMQPFLDPGPHWLCCRLSIAEMAADSVAVIESDCRWKPALTASGDMISTNNYTHPCNISSFYIHLFAAFLCGGLRVSGLRADLDHGYGKRQREHPKGVCPQRRWQEEDPISRTETLDEKISQMFIRFWGETWLN